MKYGIYSAVPPVKYRPLSGRFLGKVRRRSCEGSVVNPNLPHQLTLR